MDNTIDRLSQAYRDAGFTPIADPSPFQPRSLKIRLGSTIAILCFVVLAAIGIFSFVTRALDRQMAQHEEMQIRMQRAEESFREAQILKQKSADDLREELDLYTQSLKERVKHQTPSNRK